MKSTIEMARHALGLDGTTNVSFRNRYCAATGSPEHRAWNRMVEAGDAVRNRIKISYGEMFHLTFKGASAVLRPGEHLDLEDFPEGAG